MKNITKIWYVCLAICFVSVGCQSEPLPSQPVTNAVVVWSYPATNSATGFAADYLSGNTNNWQTSTNWQPFIRVPVVEGQTTYVVTSSIPANSLVVLWATNAVANSPWAGPVSYSPDPIKTTPATLIIQ